MPAIKVTVATGNPYTDGLLGDTQWASNSFTFSFPTQSSFYGSQYGSGEPYSGFASLNAGQQAAVRSVLAGYAEIANVSFTETRETASQHADLRFGMTATVDTAQAYFPSSWAEGGDVWFGTWGGAYTDPAPGNYAWMTIVHEFGHALGLDHPHEGRVMPTDHDSVEYTVMSYRSYVGGSTTSGYTNEDPGGYPSTMMVEDIAAIQHMYGANYATRSGDTLYRWSPATGEMTIDGVGQGQPAANRILATVWDGGGTDTYDFSAYATPVTADLRPGGWTTTAKTQLAHLSSDGRLAVGNVANAYLHEGDTRSLIENARGGSGNDSIVGNQAANVLEGGPGGDRLDGGGGLDTASYRHAAAGVTASLGDSAINFGEAKGDVYVSIEALEGSAYADRLYGDGAANVLKGGDGNDVLFGGGGSDTLSGGAGTDIASFQGFRVQYSIDRAGDLRMVGSASEGRDTLDGVEQVAFLDGRLVYDVADGAAAVFRMYDSMFDRAPDTVGFNYWIDALRNGMGVDTMAEAFAGSVEFSQRYGALSNRGFVEQLYLNVLGRPGEASGLSFWTGELDRGMMDRGHVLAGFSESAEHVQMLRAPVESGLWDRDETATQLAQFYSAAFDRRPDASGLAYWTNSVKAGAVTALAVADFFVASPEFSTRYGALSNAQFVDRMYHNILDRAGEAEGTTFWTHALDTGSMDRGDVLAGFASSTENQHKTAAATDNGILLA